MLKWLGSRLKQNQVDLLLGNDQAIDAFLAEIPSTNPQHTLAALDDWVDEPARLFAELPPPLAVRALCRLDEFAQTAVGLCWESYFRNGPRDYHSDLALKRLEKHFTNVEAAYRQALTLLAGGDGEAREPDKNALARLAIRAMTALTARKKIGHFAYTGPSNDWWKSVHELLFLARHLAILHSKQPTYPGMEASSVWREYLIGLLFETAPLSNLTPLQVDALDCIVRWAEPHFICIDSFSPQTPFRIRLDRNDGPTRCAPGQDENPAYRYFGPGQAHAHLVRLRAAISAGTVAKWLPGHCAKQELLDLLQALLQHWSMTPPQRMQSRQHVEGKLLVTHGFLQTRRMIAASEFARSGRSLDYEGYVKYLHHLREEGDDVQAEPPAPPRTPLEMLRCLETTGDRQMMASWEILDISGQGLGARFDYRRPWQVIGALVAYRHENEIDWRVGIVRRLGRSHGKPNAGLCVFDGIPQCGQVQALNHEADGVWHQQTRDTSGHGMIDAILVSHSARLLLLPKEIFSRERRVDFLLGGKRIPLRLSGVEASGSDYDLVLFRTLDTAEPASDA